MQTDISDSVPLDFVRKHQKPWDFVSFEALQNLRSEDLSQILSPIVYSTVERAGNMWCLSWVCTDLIWQKRIGECFGYTIHVYVRTPFRKVLTSMLSSEHANPLCFHSSGSPYQFSSNSTLTLRLLSWCYTALSVKWGCRSQPLQGNKRLLCVQQRVVFKLTPESKTVKEASPQPLGHPTSSRHNIH